MFMVSTTAMILQKKVVLNEYLDLFQLDSDPKKEKVLEDINAFIALVMPQITAGITPDIDAAARKTGVDPETARSVVESVLDSLDRMPGPGGEAPGGEVPDPKAVSGKKAGSKKRNPAIEKLPVQTGEEIRLLSPDDKLLFNLHLYMMAGRILQEAPWEYLFEDEVFGVQVPGTDRVYFVSVMGASGEFPALSFYKGYDGLAGFWDFRDQIEEMSQQDHASESMMQASTMMRASTMIGRTTRRTPSWSGSPQGKDLNSGGRINTCS
jgi:hypothetical protein